MMSARCSVALALSATLSLAGALYGTISGAASWATQPNAAGRLVVTFLYMPPSSAEPTYHTAMWLEDTTGKLVQTLFVSNELSANDYKTGDACPDWVKQASWHKAEKSLVDAVTGATPNVGSGAMSFDLQELGIPAGTYVFNFQVHIAERDNVRFRGRVNAGPSPQTVTIETLYSDGRRPVYEVVRDVEVRYTPSPLK